MTAVAQGNDADEALVAAATAQRQGDKLSGLDISLKRYRLGQLTNSQTTSIAINPGESESDFMNRAVAAVAADIEHGIPPSSNKEATPRRDRSDRQPRRLGGDAAAPLRCT